MENKKITRAKVGILLNHPFYATLMMRRKFIEDVTVEKTTVNGPEIRYNPTYIDTLTHAEIMGTIAHDLMHVTMMHHLRREGRDAKTFDKACDYAINPLLIDAGFSLPKGALHNTTYKGMSAEQIFRLLQKEEQQPGNKEPEDKKPGDTMPGEGMGGVKDSPVPDKAEEEAKIKMEVAQATMIARSQGKMPGGLEEVVAEIIDPKVPWKEVLARFVCEIAKNDYSFSKPNYRYISTGFMMPSLYNLEPGRVVLIVDHSGSMNKDLLHEIGSEMHDLTSMFKVPITVVYVNTQVTGTQELEPDEPVEFVVKPKGGTDFRPGFQWISENLDEEPAAVVYFTDGECNLFPDTEPTYPVLWAKYGRHKAKFPFGETITID